MKYSGFLRRFFAFCLDALIVCIPGLLAALILPYVGAMVVSFLYYVIFEISSVQATPGKYIMGIRVVSDTGSTLNLSQAIIRYFMKFVSGALMGFGYFMQIFTAKRQALHDMVAGAVIVDHQWSASPDWISAWMHQVRLILKGQESNTTLSVPDSRDRSSETAANKIIKLQDLLKQGLITEQEFLDKKSEVLTEMLKN